MNNEPKTLEGTSTLIGTIIGAGFLGIPYVIMKSGFTIGIIHLLLIGLIMMLSSLYLGEVILRTKSNHQLTGYTEKYLGSFSKKIMFFALVFGIYSALIAYLIVEGNSLSFILFGSIDYSIQMSILFWIVMATLCYFGKKSLKSGEMIGAILLFILIISIGLLFFGKINAENLTKINFENLLLPIGTIMFSFLGFTAIPEIKEILGKNTSKLKNSIIGGYVFAFIIYLIFTLIIVGYKGNQTPQIATLSLGIPFVFLSMITVFMAYLSLSNSLIDTYKMDYNKDKNIAWIYTISIPIIALLILTIFNKAEFIDIIGLGGVVTGSIIGILSIFMLKEAKMKGERRPEYSMFESKLLETVIIIFFLVGAFLEIKYFFS